VTRYFTATYSARSIALQGVTLAGVCLAVHSPLPLGIILARRIATERYAALRGPVGMLAVMLAVGAIYGAHTEHAAAAGKAGKVGKELIKAGVRHLPKHDEAQFTHSLVNDALSPLHQRRLLPAAVYRRLLQGAHDRYQVQRIIDHWQRYQSTRKPTHADIDLAGAMRRLQQDLQPPAPTSPVEIWGNGLKEYARIYRDFGKGVLRIIRDIGHKRMAGVWPFVPPGAPGLGGGLGLPM